ncbi:MAG: hypothetical protein HY812_12670 [Planctomycetes bacterium]|nr:hypothetical protein [Planctomycetota bacterium]
MTAALCALLLVLLAQDAAPPAAPESAPESSAASGAQAGGAAPAPQLENLLEHPEAHLPAIVALEAEVAALYQTLDGLVSAEEGGAAQFLQERQGDEVGLRDIGVSEKRAAQIEVLADEVSGLRAKLRLLELRAPSLNDPNEGLRDVAELVASEGAETAPGLDLEPAPGAQAEQGSAAGQEAAPREQENWLPSDPAHEALLAFRQGDMDGVIRLLGGREPRGIAPDALYVLGCALIEKRDYAAARQALLCVQEVGERRALSESARRQLERMERVQSGVVGARPQAREETR